MTPASVDVLRGTAARPPLWERAVAAAFWVIAGAIIAALYALRS